MLFQNAIMRSVSATRKTRLLRMKKVSEKPAESDHASSNPIPCPGALHELKVRISFFKGLVQTLPGNMLVTSMLKVPADYITLISNHLLLLALVNHFTPGKVIYRY